MSETMTVPSHPTYPSATPAPAPRPEGLLPYQAAKLVNGWLAEDEIDKTIPTQMLYNYTTGRIRSGKAPLIKADHFIDEDGKVHATIKLEDLTEWYKKYSAKVRALQGL